MIKWLKTLGPYEVILVCGLVLYGIRIYLKMYNDNISAVPIHTFYFIGLVVFVDVIVIMCAFSKTIQIWTGKKKSKKAK